MILVQLIMRTLILLVGTLVVGSLASPAGGTSCVMIEDGRPESIVTGNEKLWTDDGFFEIFDYAVTGVVTDVIPSQAGPTEVIVDVISAFGVETAPSEISFTMPDPGWMIGYNFTPGRVYFIPMHHEADQPPNVCDPISEMTLADAEALADIATVTVAAVTPPTPMETPTDEATPTAAPEVGPEAEASTPVWPVIGLAALAGIVLAALGIRRSRNRAT